MQRFFLFAISLITFFAFTSTSPADDPTTTDWNQWRGPNRNSIVPGKNWPEILSADNFKQLWRVPLGRGYPGPIVTKDRVFVAETKDKKQEVVRCLDRQTGKQIWETRWDGAMTVFFIARANGDWIRSTPAFDGESLFVGGMRDLLVCLDAKTGDIRWKHDFVAEEKGTLPSFGFVSSPLVDETSVYVQAGGGFAKLDKRTGKRQYLILKDSGGAFNSAFSSPLFADLHGQRQIIVQTRSHLAGVEPASGKILWTNPVPAYKNMNILTPLVVGNRIFTSTYGESSFLFDIKKTGEAWSVERAWKAKPQGYMSSPVVVKDHAYLHLRNQMLACISLADGKERWSTSERFGQYWSMIAQGDKILALDERGTIYLFRANPEKYEPLGEVKVSSQPTWGHLAASGDEIFVRELNAIAAYRWR